MEVLLIAKKDGDNLIKWLEDVLDSPNSEKAFVQLKFNLDRENAGLNEDV
jgi:hypothetical protein